ncbi:MAG: glycosyltransferase [Propionibacteriales bacterium]|nr:glycosyltransferase [Propionibacteriales bacterium]
MAQPLTSLPRRLAAATLSRSAASARNLLAESTVSALAKHPVFDADFYAAQVGTSFSSPHAAARHFVRTKAAGHFSPHPLVNLGYLPDKAVTRWQRGGAQAMLAWFTSPAAVRTPWSAFFDPRTLGDDRTAKTALKRVAALKDTTVTAAMPPAVRLALPYSVVRATCIEAAARLAAEPAVADLPVPASIEGFGGDSEHRVWVAAGEQLIDWAQAEAGVAARVPGRVSVVIPVFEDSRMTLDAVAALVEHTQGHDVEILVVDNGSSLQHALGLATAIAAFDATTVLRLERNYNFALGSNYGAVHASGEYVLFLNNDTAVRAGWLPPLLARLADPQVLGVQPLLVYPDQTIQSAGTRFLAEGYLPCTPLAGHPVEDGRSVAGLDFAVVTAAALLMRARDVVALRGFDPIFVNGSEDIDLCLRAAELRAGSFAVEPASVVEHREGRTPGRGLRIPENRRLLLQRWRGRLPVGPAPELERLGLEVSALRCDGSAYPAALPVLVRPGSVERPLRWSIKNPAPGGASGMRWGDTHFVDDLAAALTGLGQEVVSYRHGSYDAAATAFDDVNLVLRGIRRIPPKPGQLNVMWIISHPEDVTAEELAGFDLVYAASRSWAAKMSAEWGVEIRPLLQATDASAFHPRTSAELPGADADVVFVGQTRPDRPRQIVMDAIAAGVPVKVWGERWARYLPPGHLQGDYVMNADLPALYRSAKIVLSDHHPDMAAEGFVANRLFDAVASGARVISDEVAGVEELFSSAVQVYRTVDDLARLTSDEGLAAFPDAAEMARISAAVASDHSFAARARTLLNDVHEHLIPTGA